MNKLKKYVVPGFKAGAVGAGIKHKGRLDIALIMSDTPAVPAAMFTKNAVKASSVIYDAGVAKRKAARAILVNSGNANACNGPRGMEDTLMSAGLAGRAVGVDPKEVFVCSTGVIGLPMPMDRLTAGIAGLSGALRTDGWVDAARAIMTTDTFPKISGVSTSAGGRKLSIVGIAKGSGMIHPNMATMLAFVATDAKVEKPALKAALKAATDLSFNRITVDGDSSTNDSVILLANCVAGNTAIAKDGPGYKEFTDALTCVLKELARMIIKDGEGATKLVEIKVTGAATGNDADKAARSVANSPLVKTAMFAEDANWGRIVCAAGYSGAKLDMDKVKVSFDRVVMVRDGMGMGPRAEAGASAVMKKPEYTITVDLGVGTATASILTCDLSHEYVRINAEYRS